MPDPGEQGSAPAWLSGLGTLGSPPHHPKPRHLHGDGEQGLGNGVGGRARWPRGRQDRRCWPSAEGMAPGRRGSPHPLASPSPLSPHPAPGLTVTVTRDRDRAWRARTHHSHRGESRHGADDGGDDVELASLVHKDRGERAGRSAGPVRPEAKLGAPSQGGRGARRPLGDQCAPPTPDPHCVMLPARVSGRVSRRTRPPKEPLEGPERACISPRPRPRTHVAVDQHVEADAESLQQGAILTAVVRLVVLGEPGGQRGRRGPAVGACLSRLDPQGPLEPCSPRSPPSPARRWGGTPAAVLPVWSAGRLHSHHLGGVC